MRGSHLLGCLCFCFFRVLDIQPVFVLKVNYEQKRKGTCIFIDFKVSSENVDRNLNGKPAGSNLRFGAMTPILSIIYTYTSRHAGRRKNASLDKNIKKLTRSTRDLLPIKLLSNKRGPVHRPEEEYHICHKSRLLASFESHRVVKRTVGP